MTKTAKDEHDCQRWTQVPIPNTVSRRGWYSMILVKKVQATSTMETDLESSLTTSGVLAERCVNVFWNMEGLTQECLYILSHSVNI